jgi:PTS system mannose-specific IIA component
MIGIIIVSHGNLALELKSAMEHILGVQQNIEILSLFPNDDLDKKKDELEKLINEFDPNKGIIILTDMFGGTPSNLAISFLKNKKIEVISGANLPMLVKLIGLRENDDLKKIAEQAKDSAQRYISIASEILSESEE